MLWEEMRNSHLLCNMHHLAVDGLRQGLCFLGKYHILAGKLLSRTVEVCTSADNFNILHFSYMKLSCYSRHCRKILTRRFYMCLGINNIDELSWQMKHRRRTSQLRPSMRNAEPPPVDACRVFRCVHIILVASQHYLGHLGNGKFSIPDISEDLFPVSQLYGFRPVSVV